MSYLRLTAAAVAAILVLDKSGGALADEITQKKVTITYRDLTGTQPLSSSAWVSHKDGVHLWQEGSQSSLPVKRLAEEGNPEFILGTAFFDRNHSYLDEAVALPAFPGQGRSVTLSVDADHPQISGAWMLGMTNDGFAGLDAVDAFHLSAPMSVDVFALDAGTRNDSEKKEYTAAFGGIVEDPENGTVSRHNGIRGDADIPASFKFDSTKPVGRIVIAPASASGS